MKELEQPNGTLLCAVSDKYADTHARSCKASNRTVSAVWEKSEKHTDIPASLHSQSKLLAEVEVEVWSSGRNKPQRQS